MSEHIHHPNYTKVYFWLLGLLIVSVMGPMAEIRWLTLVTAFGIAIVKAYLVAVNFMHVSIAPRYVAYLMGTTLLFVLLFFTATAPDVMRAEGRNWEKPSWILEADAAPSMPDAGHH